MLDNGFVLFSYPSQWNMQLEKVFELEDLSRNAGSSDRCVWHSLWKICRILIYFIRGQKVKRMSLEKLKVGVLVLLKSSFRDVCFKLCLTLAFLVMFSSCVVLVLWILSLVRVNKLEFLITMLMLILKNKVMKRKKNKYWFNRKFLELKL